MSVHLPSYAGLYSFAQGSSGFSGEARQIGSALAGVAAQGEQSQALFGARAKVITQLGSLAQDCGEPGWDGGEASPISPLALANATDFVRALPESFPMPECTAEPDGAISLDWVTARHRLFSLSIGDTDRLAFAWLDGTDKGHGVARFDGQCIPDLIVTGICSSTGHHDASIRVA